jgi:hypothetical protein
MNPEQSETCEEEEKKRAYKEGANRKKKENRNQVRTSLGILIGLKAEYFL